MGMRMRELEGLFLDWLSSACTRGPAHCHQQTCAPAIAVHLGSVRPYMSRK